MKEKQKLVSIILNCFNGEKYLKDALETVVNQTYNNWELVFWDNKSNDGSKKMLELYGSKKFKYYRSNVHTPLYEARNSALRECKGEYIAFIDADDYWKKDKISKQLIFMKKKKSDISHTSYNIINESGKKISSRIAKNQSFLKLIQSCDIGLSTVMLKKK